MNNLITTNNHRVSPMQTEKSPQAQIHAENLAYYSLFALPLFCKKISATLSTFDSHRKNSKARLKLDKIRHYAVSMSLAIEDMAALLKLDRDHHDNIKTLEVVVDKMLYIAQHVNQLYLPDFDNLLECFIKGEYAATESNLIDALIEAEDPNDNDLILQSLILQYLPKATPIVRESFFNAVKQSQAIGLQAI